MTAAAAGPPLPLSLVVFAYNEATNVPGVLGEILAWLEGRGAPFQLLFVDDGSTDGTGDAARAVIGDRPEGQVLRHDRNRGIGAALKTGVRAAVLPWVTFLPCDGQIAPTSLQRLLDAAQPGAGAPPDVVFSVYEDRDDGWHRTLMSAGIRGLIQAMFRVNMRSDGPYLFRRELFDPDLLVPDSFFLNFEFPIRALRQGLRHAIVSIPCAPRRSGHSKSTGLKRVAGVARDLVSLRLRLAPRALASRRKQDRNTHMGS
jgi:glycosyltransferase involved in cell wall biosynthesis